MNETDTPLDPRLLVLTREPLNAETSLVDHVGVITPTELFYKRNHFPIPSIDARSWSLEVGGTVNAPLRLTYEDLRSMRSRTLLATLECAGNARVSLHPPVPGEQWRYGAVSTGEWTGVSLKDVLEAAGVRQGTVEILAEGIDGGQVPEAGSEPIHFARSLPLSTALHPNTLLAYGMNGQILPREHGFPVRLIVPGWYGVASVKWLARLEALEQPFPGFYQRSRYVYDDGTPLRPMAVRSLISEPVPGAALSMGRQMIRGYAWSGSAAIDRVEVSVDGGASWQWATLIGQPLPSAWRRWELPWSPTRAGPVTIESRAFDSAGNAQSPEQVWNRLGYANNAIQTISVEVE